jgi:hypothetical protein
MQLLGNRQVRVPTSSLAKPPRSRGFFPSHEPEQWMGCPPRNFPHCRPNYRDKPALDPSRSDVRTQCPSSRYKTKLCSLETFLISTELQNGLIAWIEFENGDNWFLSICSIHEAKITDRR